MYIFYSFLLLLGLIFHFPLYFFRRTLLRRENLHLKKRLGCGLVNERNQKKSIWIHAVSVGEVISLQNLVRKLKEKHSSWVVNFSSLTNTGLLMAKKKLQKVDNIFFIPLDFALIVKKFFNAYSPKVFVLAESEFWPNILRIAKKKGCAVILINGRISDRSYKRYYRFRFLTKKVLKNIDLFLVQTEQDKDKLEKIGVSSGRIDVAGNLKAEIDLPLLDEEKISIQKKNLNINNKKKVIVAGSTRKGEEEQLLEAFFKAKKIRSDLLLILAPRNPERFNEVIRICENFPFIVQRKSDGPFKDEWDILVLDTIGELGQFYALSDVAFVGGSLVPWGGHNILEPAFYKKPVFFGPYMKNFAFLAEKFVQSGAAQVTRKKEDLVEMFLIKEEKVLLEMGKKAKETLDSLQGATKKTIKAIETLMTR